MAQQGQREHFLLSCMQVDLGNVRSFYKESQKSPFKFFPWKTGSMHFKFLSVCPDAHAQMYSNSFPVLAGTHSMLTIAVQWGLTF